MNDKTLHIVLCFDDRVLAAGMVAVVTAIKNCKRYKVFAHVVSHALSEASCEKLTRVCEMYGGAGFDCRKVDLEAFKTISEEGKKLSNEVYLNFLIPSALPELDKVIYLDADTFVRADLSDLWEMDMKGFACLGSDKGWTKHDWCRKETGLSESDVYINNGVMVLDLATFRRDGLQEKLTVAAVRYGEKMNCMDQDVFNMELRGRIGNFSNLWNFTSNEYCRDDRPHKRVAKVHHYTYVNGLTKPWQGGVEWRDRLWRRENLVIDYRLSHAHENKRELALRLLVLNVRMWCRRIIFFWAMATFNYQKNDLITRFRILGSKVKRLILRRAK